MLALRCIFWFWIQWNGSQWVLSVFSSPILHQKASEKMPEPVLLLVHFCFSNSLCCILYHHHIFCSLPKHKTNSLPSAARSRKHWNWLKQPGVFLGLQHVFSERLWSVWLRWPSPPLSPTLCTWTQWSQSLHLASTNSSREEVRKANTCECRFHLSSTILIGFHFYRSSE